MKTEKCLVFLLIVLSSSGFSQIHNREFPFTSNHYGQHLPCESITPSKIALITDVRHRYWTLISPGETDSSMLIQTNYFAEDEAFTKAMLEKIETLTKEKFDVSKKVPLRRVGEHQELANLAAYLLSNYSAYINGEVITIDGGEWLQGAGEFNMLEKVPKELWDMLEMMIRSKKEK